MTAVMTALLRIIGVVTVLSGAVQMIVPGFVLHLVGGQGTDAALHFFGIVGMFMILFGILMVQGLRPGTPRYPLFIAGLQKLGASGAIGIGIVKGLFASVAWLVGGFDFLSGLLVMVYLTRSGDRS